MLLNVEQPSSLFHKPLSALSVEVKHESMDGHDDHDPVPDATHMRLVHKT